MKYKLSMFNFKLPQNRIANKPSENREDAKLMVIHRSTEEIEHKHVSDLGDYFDEGDVIALNNTVWIINNKMSEYFRNKIICKKHK